MNTWIPIDQLETIPSPALLVDVDRVRRNIDAMLQVVEGDAKRLRPHVKTHKMPAMITMQLEAGISAFKAATIAEARMVASAGASDVLLAYPMVGANIPRLLEVTGQFPQCQFAVVADHPTSVADLGSAFAASAQPLRVMIDVDCGMHRTGVAWGEPLNQVRAAIEQHAGLTFAGLHVYDGHLHQPERSQRQSAVQAIAEQVDDYVRRFGAPEVVAGGSPTFALWAEQAGVRCSPGTTVFWDIGYAEKFTELPFEIAAVLLTRVISKSGSRRVCVDLGYKSIASEMPLDRRVEIPAIADARWIGHSEEHLVLETELADTLSIGQPLIAFPRHICPTVALHDWAHVIRNASFRGERWPVTARSR